MHGGTIEVHSPGIGLGSEFVIRLPLARETHGEGETGKKGDRASGGGIVFFGTRTRRVWGASPCGVGCFFAGGHLPQGQRILVVDDNQDAANCLAKLLRKNGHEVRAAYDGLEAVAAAAAFQPQVVLLDIGLPKLDGYEAARRIRASPGNGDVVFIAVTGWDRRKTVACPGKPAFISTSSNRSKRIRCKDC